MPHLDKAGRRYDPDLQMFVETAKDLNWGYLCLLRSLAEHELLEHSVAGEPSGPSLDGRTDRDVAVLQRARLGVAVYTVPLLAVEAGL